ncbi:MAG: histidinol dehydrogenase [Candidatus Bathyarchaeia archaeon]
MIGPKLIGDISPSELDSILRRSRYDIESVSDTVRKIVDDVRDRGDAALVDYTYRFDRVGMRPSEFRVTKDEIEEARSMVPEGLEEALKEMRKRIERYHVLQLRSETGVTRFDEGIYLGRVRRAIDSVGMYVPGGRASYPSTVLMMVVPARIAGVKSMVMCTPPTRQGKANPAALVAANLVDVTEIFKLGGAQAIAAMAFGTETIPKVEKIVGPGNIFVTAAKSLVYGHVDLDFPAGPSELMVLTDETADPELVAIDLVSQAEHDSDAACVLITTSWRVAREVEKVLTGLVKREERSETIKASLAKNGAIVVAEKMEEAVAFVNEYAPEHLEVITENPMNLLKEIRHAGSIFLGPSSPASAGDYATGTNHVLPTGGRAKVRGPLSVDDFLKFSSVQLVNKAGLRKLEAIISVLARVEGLPAHAKSVEKRLRR